MECLTFDTVAYINKGLHTYFSLKKLIMGLIKPFCVSLICDLN